MASAANEQERHGIEKPRIVRVLEHISRLNIAKCMPIQGALNWLLDTDSQGPQEGIGDRLLESGIISLEKYQGNSPRVEGFITDQRAQSEIKKYHGLGTIPTKDITIFDEQIYKRWHENGHQFEDNDKKLLQTVFDNTLKINGRGVLRRSIYHRDTMETPSLPTYNGKKTSDEMFASLQDLYEKIADKFYGDEYVKECFIYPYVDPIFVEDPIKADEKDLPVGGIAYPLETLEESNGHITIEIKVGYGDSAAHNSGHPQADTIRVKVNKPDKMKKHFPAGVPYIDSKEDREIYAFKNVMIVNRSESDIPSSWNASPITDENGNASGMFEVPIGDRTLNVPLFSNWAESIAIHLAQSMWLTGKTRKLEFSMGMVKTDEGEEMLAPVILENVPFTLPEKLASVVDVGFGHITQVLNDELDIAKLETKLEKSNEHNSQLKTIVACTTNFVNKMRNNKGLQDRLNGIGTKLVIFSLLNSTEHVARNLAEQHTLIPGTFEMIQAITSSSNVTYSIDQLYKIQIRDGYGILIPASDTDNVVIPDILTIKQARLMGFDYPEIIGGKGFGHSQLDRLNFPTPENSLVLTPAFVDRIISANDLTSLFEELSHSVDEHHLETLFRKIHEKISHIPEDLVDTLMSKMSENFRGLYSSDVANFLFVFRSNLSIEDDGKHPMAGTFESELRVHFDRAEIESALLNVIKGYFKEGVAHKIHQDIADVDIKKKLKTLLGSVLIEPRQPSKYSGTAFSWNRSGVSKSDKESLRISFSSGVGGVVDGSDAITISRKRYKQDFTIHFPSKDGRSMTSNEFKALPANDTSLGPPKYILINLLRLCKYAADNLGEEQDMEYSILHDEITDKWSIVYLQTRPILKI